MKKKIFVCAVIAICLSIAAYGTTAYFSYEATATNVITAGSVKIDLQEWAIPEDGGEPVPFENVIGVQPGVEVSKIVQIKNVGGEGAWVRISLDTSIRLAEGVHGEADPSLVGLDLNTECWTEKDGWYYYNTILYPNETTEPLFTKVSFSATMSNMYQHSEAVIGVTAHATQSVHNGNTVLEAAGWPNAE